jgi:ACS family glucarate transporter-like MFS transporter
MMVQYFASNFTFFFSLTWLLPHLQRRFDLSATTAGWLGGITLISGMLGNWLSGWLVDHWHRQGWGHRSRRGVAVIGFGIAAAGMCVLAVSESLSVTLVGLCLAVFGADMTLAPSWSFCSDIGGPRAGTVSGTMNMAGNLGALLTSLAFPYLLVWTGSPSPFFVLAATLNVLAIFCWQKTTAKTLQEEASDE